LESKLIKLPVVKAAELRRRATECSDKTELRYDDVNDETKSGLLRKHESILGFTLHIDEGVSGRQKVRVHVVAAVRRKTEIADPVRGLERPTHHVKARSDMFRPGHHVASETHIGPGLEALQFASFDQLIAKLTKSKAGIVIAEMRAGHHAQVYKGEARPVADAMLKAQVNRSANHQRTEVRIPIHCRWYCLGKDVQSCQACGIVHERHPDELLDLAAAELQPDALVFLSRFLFRRPG